MAFGDAGGRNAPSGRPTLRADGRSVSPVIGVVLVVAITIILATTVGGIVFGLDSEEEPAPHASFSFEANTTANAITLTHEGGDTLYSDRTRIVWEIDNETYRSSPTDAREEMSSAETTTFTFDGSTGSSGAWSDYGSPGSESLQPDDVVTVTFYDSEANKRIYSEEFSVREVLP